MLTMFLLMLLDLAVLLLLYPLAATLSCPELVHTEVNGTSITELKERSCSTSYCTVVLYYNNIQWSLNQMLCSPSCVPGNTSGALGVHYTIGCCNSSSCTRLSDFFNDISVNISWPLLQRAPILTSSTIQPTAVTATGTSSIDGRSSSFLACATCSPSVTTNKFDYKPCKH